MPDSAISDLTLASQILPPDLFVLEQNGTAKKLTGQTLVSWLTAYADGHGGINTISLVSTQGDVKTYRIILADETTFDYQVSDGRGITSIAWTTSGTAGDGQTHTGTINYSDGTTSQVVFRDGLKGSTGTSYYTWIKYASVMPASNDDMTDIPSDYIGIYTGTLSSAPALYTSYRWYKYKGEQGPTGAPAVLESAYVVYQVGQSGSIPPQGTWLENPPAVPQGQYLWTRTSLVFNSGDPVLYYTVARFGMDGSGSVSSVNQVSPDSEGNVTVQASDIPYGSSTVDTQLQLLSSLAYNSGESVTNKQMQAFGYVSTSKYIAINILLPKFLTPDKSITISSLKSSMCIYTGGYLEGTAELELVNYITFASVKGNLLTVSLKKSDGWSTQNLTPMTGSVYVSFLIS